MPTTSKIVAAITTAMPMMPTYIPSCGVDPADVVTELLVTFKDSDILVSVECGWNAS